MMKIFIISHHYPSREQPYLNTFLRDHFQAVEAMEKYEPELLIPTPYALPLTKRWKRNTSPLLDEHAGTRVNYISIPSQLAPRLTSRQLLRNLLKTLPEPDGQLLHLHWIYPSGLTIPALSKAGYRTILHIHGSDWYMSIRKQRFLKPIKESLYAADFICVSGPRLKQDILDRFPDLEIRVIYNYIDTGRFTLPDAGTSESAKEKLHFDPDRFHFLTIANIRHEKGVDLLLDAIRNLDRNDVCFHIIGQPPSGRFANLIDSKMNELEPGRAFIHDPVPREELVTWYHAADAYLLPSRSEGFNVSLLEALSTGLPAIATNVGGAKEVLGEGRGLLVEPEDAESVRRAVLELLGRKGKGRSEKARLFIEKNYSMEQHREFLEVIYSGMMDF